MPLEIVIKSTINSWTLNWPTSLNKPKSHILFQNNISSRNLYKLTLIKTVCVLYSVLLCRQYTGIGTVIKQSLIFWTDRLKMPIILEQAVVDWFQQVGFIYIIIHGIAVATSNFESLVVCLIRGSGPLACPCTRTWRLAFKLLDLTVWTCPVQYDIAGKNDWFPSYCPCKTG